MVHWTSSDMYGKMSLYMFQKDERILWQLTATFLKHTVALVKLV